MGSILAGGELPVDTIGGGIVAADGFAGFGGEVHFAIGGE